MLRNNRPALTSSTAASETSVTTSVRRIHCRLPVARPEPWRIPLCRSLREACQFDTSPTAIPIKVVSSEGKHEDSTIDGDRIAGEAVRAGSAATSARAPASATTTPSAPPSVASSRHSVSS